MANSDNIVSELLGAIDTVVGKRLGQLSYDKTIICTIIDDSNAKNGEYRVTDGSVKFLAKCENTSYRKDEQVRVSVPNGDTTQEKFIIGKYVKDNSNTPITYMTPLSSVLQMSGNLYNNDASSVFGLKASGPTEEGTPTKTGVLLWSADITGDNAAMISSQIYDVIYVQADFKTILSNYNITSGTYGLILSLGTVLGDGVTPGPPVTCVFDSAQMMGNPYAFGIYTSQAAKFDITNVGKLSSIQLLFYQDGNFQHTTKSLIPENVPVGEFNNLLIKNVKVGFGTDVMNIADETVKIFTTDDLRYDNDETNTIHNHKALKLAWYNKDENGQYLGFNDGLGADGNIKFVDEDAYLVLAGRNAQLKAQQNYDIPMDERGLALASEMKIIKDNLLSVSQGLKIDLHKLIVGFKERCNISSYADDFDALDDLVCKQALSVNGKNNLTAAVNDCYDWYIKALNEAAAIYNRSLVPSVSGGYQFKGTGNAPANVPTYHAVFSNYFTSVYNAFYDEGEFLPVLKALVTGDYSGYKGIYDDFNRRITTLITQLQDKWTSTLALLNGNDNEVMAYFGTYNFVPWEEQDTADYDNGYCIYWYRSNADAQGDSFVSKGWARITDALNNSIDGIEVDLDAVNTSKEEFKALVIYNHERYESNILTFENQSPVVNTATAILSDGITLQHGENSQDSYQSYSVANTLINGADRYAKRQISLQFAHADGTVDNDALINAQVYWYFPKEATMLDYDLNDLKGLHASNDFTNDITVLPDFKSDRQRDGFICFYKTIGYGLTEGNVSQYINDLTFSYRIKNYYVPTASQNTIYCEVVKNNNIYKTEITMNFASFGTSGTDYSLVVSPVGKQAAITPSNIGDNAWALKITLYDNKNEEIEIPNLSVAQKVTGSRFTAALQGNTCYVNYGNSGVLCGLLEFTVSGITHGTGEKLVDLKTYYPIPYSSNIDYYIEGASTVVYDSQGGNPTYYKDQYKLFKQATEANDWDVTVPAGAWSIQYTPGGTDPKWNTIQSYMPILQDGKLLPSNMWVDGGDITYDDSTPPKQTSHCAYVQYKSGEDVLWSQPILIIQNRYPSPMINAWDGEFEINEENGTVMSTMVGAGRKTANNTFEGVLMGDIASGAKFNPDNKSGLGIYGFNDGAQSFGLSIDGTAFFGKAGRGRILIDGNSGTISSASYQQNRGDSKETNTAGMLIDLDDGMIDMRGTSQADSEGHYTPDGTQSRIHIDVKAPYFYINSTTGKRLINISDLTLFSAKTSDDQGYYLQTNNYSPSGWSSDSVPWTTGSGMLIDLAEGRLDAYDFTLRGEDSASRSYIKLSSDPSQMIKVFYRDENIDDDSGLVVFEMGTNNYIMHSFNWWSRIEGGTEPLTGMEFNIRDGKFTAYSSNTAQAGKYIVIDASDDSSNYPLMVGTPGSEALKIAWDGALSVNNSSFNIDASGNFWINGTDLDNAIFSVTNQGVVTMKRGSITIGDVFSISEAGELFATSGTIGGWNISPSKLSKGVIELLDTGTIQSTKDNLTINGVTGALSATSADFTTITIRGKTHFTSTAYVGINVTPNSKYDLYVNGKTYLKGNIGIGLAPNDDYTLRTNGSIYVSGEGNSIGNDGCALKFYANGLWCTGNLMTLDISYCQVGQSNACTMTFLNGSVLNLYGDFHLSGDAYFTAPNNIIVDGTKTLPQYIEAISSGEDGVTAIGYAHTAHKIGTSASNFTSTGNATTPIYLKNGEFVECSAYPDLTSYATREWVNDKNYATKTWVENKGYLTSVPSEYITESELNNKGYLTSIPSEYITESELNSKNYITSSALPNMELYVLKTVYDEKIAELEEKIAALTPST